MLRIFSSRSFRGSSNLLAKYSSTKVISNSEKYKRVDQTEHILLRPDSYIGSNKLINNENHWLYDEGKKKMVLQEMCYVPGLLKIFDEILVNAADNKQRDSKMTKLEIDINRATSEISIRNNGKGVPIEMHESESIYIPSLIFGTLLTSSNYNDFEKRTVGGRNGYGAKLTNIFSSDFTVETVDATAKLYFKQTWNKNMSVCGDVTIQSIDDVNVKDYTKITFIPDFCRFGLTSLDEQIIKMFKKRAYDMAGTLADVDIFFNGSKLAVKGFEEFVNLFVDPSSQTAHCIKNERWDVGVAESHTGFRHISYVNNISTFNGGSHVDHITNKIVAKLKDLITKKLTGDGLSVLVPKLKSHIIKNHLCVFIKCLIENPSFDSQTKELLTTQPNEFGSSINIPNSFIKQLLDDSNIYDNIVSVMQTSRSIKQDTQSKNAFNLHPKLEDALFAGTTNSDQCSLFVTEGDSAKSLAVAGLTELGKEGRERYGVFPLTGKILNVRGMSFENAMKNECISSLVRILGLTYLADYSNPKNRETLRYNKLIIFTDQDLDGIHIKGLLMNFIHYFWPALINQNFIQGFKTPLLKAKKGKATLSFYSTDEYKKWQAETEDSYQYKIKYYKGLGTSSNAEAKEYFANLEAHLVNYNTVNEEDAAFLVQAFDKTNPEGRRELICTPKDFTIPSNEINYRDFVKNDSADYFRADCRRSIPNVMDGLKPSQRKVLYTMLNRNDTEEMKVSQLAGIVSQSVSYHHGEESLLDTIIKMSQTFVGTGNLNLLKPIGQFGTRSLGGNDHASARYIFTKLNSTTRLLFPKEDDNLLELLEEDQKAIEPNYYVPIIPNVLINGCDGIGSGYKTSVYAYHPIEIINNVKGMIDGKEPIHMIPFYKNFKGSIEQNGSKFDFAVKGCAQIMEPVDSCKSSIKVKITELPLWSWNQSFKEKVLGKLHESKILESFQEHHSEDNVCYHLKLNKNKLGQTKLMNKKGEVQLNKLLGLTKTFSTKGMYLFDAQNNLKLYKDTGTIFKDFFDCRKEFYERRLNNERVKMQSYFELYNNQINFIKEVISGKIDMRNMSKSQLESTLKSKDFKFNPLKENNFNDFDYLINMPFRNLCNDEIVKLQNKWQDKEKGLKELQNISWNKLWKSDLDKFEKKINF